MSRISKLKDENYHIDFDKREVYEGKEKVADITRDKHLSILEYLARAPKEWRKRIDIYDACWEDKSGGEGFDEGTFNRTMHDLKRIIHAKVGESIDSKRGSGYRYLGGPITDEDMRRIESGEPIITDNEGELLRAAVFHKIYKATGATPSVDVIDELVFETIERVKRAVWDDFEFVQKARAVYDTYCAIQLLNEAEVVLTLSNGGK